MLAVGRTAHIGAQERCGWALLLRIPRGAVTREIGRVNFFLAALPQIRIETRPARLDFFFRFAAIQQVELGRHGGGSVRSRVDDVGRQVARARQYRFEEPTRNAPGLRLFVTEDEKTVGPGRKPALDD